MKVLVFTTLYPNAVRPQHGVFVENRLREVLRCGDVDARVVAPVPYFPFRHHVFGEYARYAAVPRREIRHGVEVRHPRYLNIPAVGMNLAPLTLYLGALRAIDRLIDEGFRFDLIDAHYFYPDGVAAALLARRYGRPFVITGRGTDLNLVPAYALPRRMIRWAAARADGLVTVCEALRRSLAGLGVPPARTRVLRNGVDLVRFAPGDRAAARRRLGWSGPRLLSVGHLIPRKGHDLVIRALALLPEWRLAIAGSGPEGERLRALAVSEGVADRVEFLGQVPHEALAEIYGAADVLVLASSREGWANVLLEAMACGTPVVATDVWGTAEVVAAPEAGELMRERTPAELAAALRRLEARRPDRSRTRRYAEGFGWDETAAGVKALFSEIVEARRRADAGPVPVSPQPNMERPA